MPKKKLTQDIVLEMYSDYVLSNNTQPKSVYEFMKHFKRSEQDFYKFFGSLEGLQKSVFTILFNETFDILLKDKNFREFDFKNQLLSFYFTYIENLTMNRSFISIMLSGSKVESAKYLCELRKEFLKWVDKGDSPKSPNKHINKILGKTTNELYWIQFLAIIGYWLKMTLKI